MPAEDAMNGKWSIGIRFILKSHIDVHLVQMNAIGIEEKELEGVENQFFVVLAI
jgi:hypothetical protein